MNDNEQMRMLEDQLANIDPMMLEALQRLVIESAAEANI